MQLAWRLFTGHQRKWGGGLLSPFVLTLTGLAFCAFAVSLIWQRGPSAAGGAAIALIPALAMFSMAATQWRRARKQKLESKDAF